MIQQEQNDVGMEDALMDSQANAFMEKAKKPIVWCRLPFGVRIEDLHQSYYEEVIDLVKRHYVPDEPTFTSVKMSQDEASMDEFLSLCNVWIRDTCSMVAVEEGEKKAVGALIGRVYIKKEMNREFARVSIYKTEPLRKVQTLKHFISKKFDVFQSLCKKKYYKIYMVVVHRDYRRRGIGKSLMRCVFGMCRGFRIEVAAGIFPSFISQNMFFKLGGKVGYEMAYEDYVVDGSVVFSSTGDLNYSLALMYLIIPPKDEGVYAEKVEDRPPVPRRRDLQFVSDSKTLKS